MINYALIEAIALKLSILDQAEVHTDSDEERVDMCSQRKAINWMINLLGIEKEVSLAMQKIIATRNKAWQKAQQFAKEDTTERMA